MKSTGRWWPRCEEVTGEPVVASCDAPGGLQSAKGVFSTMSFPARLLAETERLLPGRSVQNDAPGATLTQPASQLQAVISVIWRGGLLPLSRLGLWAEISQQVRRHRLHVEAPPSGEPSHGVLLTRLADGEGRPVFRDGEFELKRGSAVGDDDG